MSARQIRKQVDIAELPGMSLAQLRDLWVDLMGRTRKPPPSPRSILQRELAWRIQSERDPAGGIDDATQRLLNAAVRNALARAPETPSSRAATARKPSTRTVATAPASSRLVRLWGGTSHEVLILEGGTAFEYRNRRYRSLSAIAREITGTAWSGPRFFGLARRTDRPGGTP